MAVPSHVRFISDIETFRYAALLSLIRCHNLKLVSVWNPTFFSLLVDRLPEWGDRLARDHASPRLIELTNFNIS